MDTFFCLLPANVVEVTGRDRVDLLHRLSTNDLRPLQTPGRVVSTLFCTSQGKLIDWTHVGATASSLWVETSQGRAGRIASWIDHYTIMEDVATVDRSSAWQKVWLSGPQAAQLAGLASLPSAGQFVAAAGAMWRRALPAYDERLEGMVAQADAPALAAGLRQGGAVQVDAVGDETRRILAGVPSPHQEFKDEVNPLELRLTAHAVGWNKGCYIGQEVISRLDSYDKVARLMMGIELETPLHFVEGMRLTRDDKPLGRVTSLVPAAPGSVGLGLVKREAAMPGEAQLALPSGERVLARLVERPFFGVV